MGKQRQPEVHLDFRHGQTTVKGWKAYFFERVTAPWLTRYYWSARSSMHDKKLHTQIKTIIETGSNKLVNVRRRLARAGFKVENRYSFGMAEILMAATMREEITARRRERRRLSHRTR